VSKDSSNSAVRDARFSIGQVVRHRIYPFRGVIFDVDLTFANTAIARSDREDPRDQHRDQGKHRDAEADRARDAHVGVVTEHVPCTCQHVDPRAAVDPRR